MHRAPPDRLDIRPATIAGDIKAFYAHFALVTDNSPNPRIDNALAGRLAQGVPRLILFISATERLGPIPQNLLFFPARRP